MEMLRLPDACDYVYISNIDTPNIEHKYMIYDITDDGYLIKSEDNPTDDSSLIKYLFRSEKWIVVNINKSSGKDKVSTDVYNKDKYNVRIEMNSDIREVRDIDAYEDQIIENILDRQFENAKILIDEYQSNIIPNIITTIVNRDTSIYESILCKDSIDEIIEILEWLKRNYLISYTWLIYYSIEESRYGVIEWILDQHIDLIQDRGIEDLRMIWDITNAFIIDEDDVKMMKLLSYFPGLFEMFDIIINDNSNSNNMKRMVDNPSNIIEYIESFKNIEAVNILEFLKSVPTKSVQIKHLN